MLVVPQLVIHSSRIAIGDELPPVREARRLRSMGAVEIGLLDLDGGLAIDHLPSWVAALVAISGVPVRFDGRLHDGAGIERATRAGFGTVVVDQRAVFDPMLLRWALDVFGPRLAVEVQVDGDYVFDAPEPAFGRDLQDVLGDLHFQGVRRVLYRDVTGEALPVQRLLQLGDRLPGMRFSYQGRVHSTADIEELAFVGPAMEAVLVGADLVLDGTLDLALANRAAAAGGGAVGD